MDDYETAGGPGWMRSIAEGVSFFDASNGVGDMAIDFAEVFTLARRENELMAGERNANKHECVGRRNQESDGGGAECDPLALEKCGEEKDDCGKAEKADGSEESKDGERGVFGHEGHGVHFLSGAQCAARG